MEVQIEIVDTHIVYNTINNEPFKIVFIKEPNILPYKEVVMCIRYGEFLWLSVIFEEKLEKIQKSDDITFDIDNNTSGCIEVNIGDFKRYLYKVNNNNNNTNNINNYMYTHLELFEIDEQQYVLK